MALGKSRARVRGTFRIRVMVRVTVRQGFVKLELGSG